MATSFEDLGSSLRGLILGLVGESGSGTASRPSGRTGTSGPSTPGGWDSPTAPVGGTFPWFGLPNPAGVFVMINVPGRIKPSDLIFAVQKTGIVAAYDAKTGASEILCEFHNTGMILWSAVATTDGMIYAALSGGHDPGGKDPSEIHFGVGGAIFKINLRTQVYAVIPGTETLRDPSHIEFLPNGHLLVSDFDGFGGTGSVYEIDPDSGVRRTIATGGILVDPVSAILRPGGGKYYCANAHQSYEIPVSPTGAWQKDWGNIVEIDDATGATKVVYDETATRKGPLAGIVATPDPRYVIGIRSDWPQMTESAVEVIDLDAKSSRPLLEASVAQPRFFGHGAAVADGMVYFVDSYQKELFVVGLSSGKVEERRSVAEFLGPIGGQTGPTQTIETIYHVPAGTS